MQLHQGDDQRYRFRILHIMRLNIQSVQWRTVVTKRKNIINIWNRMGEKKQYWLSIINEITKIDETFVNKFAIMLEVITSNCSINSNKLGENLSNGLIYLLPKLAAFLGISEYFTSSIINQFNSYTPHSLASYLVAPKVLEFFLRD